MNHAKFEILKTGGGTTSHLSLEKMDTVPPEPKRNSQSDYHFMECLSGLRSQLRKIEASLDKLERSHIAICENIKLDVGSSVEGHALTDLDYCLRRFIEQYGDHTNWGIHLQGLSLRLQGYGLTYTKDTLKDMVSARLSNGNGSSHVIQSTGDGGFIESPVPNDGGLS